MIVQNKLWIRKNSNFPGEKCQNLRCGGAIFDPFSSFYPDRNEQGGGLAAFEPVIFKKFTYFLLYFLNKSNKNFLTIIDDLLKSASEFAKIQTSPRKNAKT